MTKLMGKWYMGSWGGGGNRAQRVAGVVLPSENIRAPAFNTSTRQI